MIFEIAGQREFIGERYKLFWPNMNFQEKMTTFVVFYCVKISVYEMDNIFQNGSKWLRADFHLHTKADRGQFIYTGSNNDFVNAYVKKLQEQNIGVGVITNHNKFDLEEYKAIAKKARKEGIFVLPGVELSVDDGANGIHCFLVFDFEKWYFNGEDYINQFLTAAFEGIANRENENTRCRYSFEEVLKKVNDHANNGRNAVIIPLDETPRHQKDEEKRTFVKMGDFNFEAFKYALSDPDYRIAQKDKPDVINPYIKSIAFEGGLLNGTKIDFSPELNTLIGIRGSGKSSILEILRYTLGIPLSNIAAATKYKNGLIEYVLKSAGKAIVTIVDKNKEEYRIEKIYGQKEDIYKENMKLPPGISVQTVFDPPVYFGQNDLSSNDVDFEADLIQRLTGTRLKYIQSKIEQKKLEINNIITEIKKLRNLCELKKETETVIENAKSQLNFFREKGVEEKLKQQMLFDSDISKLEQTDSTLNSYLNELESMISNYEYYFLQEITGSDVNKEVFEEARLVMQDFKTAFEILKTVHENSVRYHQDFTALIVKMNVKKEGLKEEFAKIKRELNTDTINPDNYLILNRQFEISKLKLLEIEKSEKKRNELENELLTKLTELENLWLEEYDLLKKEVDKINGTDKKLIITVEFKNRRDKFTDKMKQVFKGSGIYETAYQEIESTYRDFIEIYRDSSKLHTILNENQAVDIKRRLRENLEYLLTYKVDNRISIQYNGKSLDKHSLGQRASALILFLLAQKENNVLIIDQPEDDLDNQTIYDEVIKKLKQLKGNMQFIFATHNANIPVLGDSEKVIACSFDEKKITIHSGTIDNHITQRHIVDIMEGGDDAFHLRKNIYTIWNIDKSKTK